MEIVRRLTVPCAPAELFAHVDDLDRYPAWMSLIHDVERLDVGEASEPMWEVELRATVGPFARSKRLRMRRVEHRPGERVVFERAEDDGRTHAPWVLRADLEPVDDGTKLTMRLTYGGNLWSGALLERVLDERVADGSRRLLKLVTSRATGR